MKQLSLAAVPMAIFACLIRYCSNTMSKVSIFALTIFSVLIFAGCDRPVCKNTNPVFDHYAPESKTYKDELIKQLTKVDRSKLSFWMESYSETKNSKQICANIQGDGLCAKIVLEVSTSRKGIEDLIKRKGASYSGAEFENLKFEIRHDSITTQFIFQEISGIVD